MRHHGVFLLGALLSGCAATGSSTVIGPAPTGEAVVTPEESPTDETKAEPVAEGPVDYAALFGPPASSDATANSLTGLWAGQGQNGQDMRIKFGPSSIILAVRCPSGSSSSSEATIGMKVTARITSTSVKILESKSERLPTSSLCSLSVTPDERELCGSSSSSSSCIDLEGTKLALYGFLHTSSSTFTKLSD